VDRLLGVLMTQLLLPLDPSSKQLMAKEEEWRDRWNY
jgi:hypothetical protein